MIKKIAFLLLVLGFSTLVFSQDKVKGSRNVILNETALEPFNKILLSERFDVILVESNSPAVEIEADDNLHEYIKFQVVDSVLSFNTTARIVSSKKLEIKVRFTQELKEIELKENAEISALDKVQNDELLLKTHDNSRAYLNVTSPTFNFISNDKSKSRLNIQSQQVTLELNDNSNLEALIVSDSLKATLYMHSKATLEGDANTLDINTISSSDFIGKNLAVKTCTLNAEDTSDVEVNVLETITVNLSGNSDAILYGNAKVNLETFTGSSTLQKKEL